MSNIAFLCLPLTFSSLPAVLPFVSPSSQVFIVVSGSLLRGELNTILVLRTLPFSQTLATKLLESSYLSKLTVAFFAGGTCQKALHL